MIFTFYYSGGVLILKITCQFGLAWGRVVVIGSLHRYVYYACTYIFLCNIFVIPLHYVCAYICANMWLWCVFLMLSVFRRHSQAVCLHWRSQWITEWLDSASRSLRVECYSSKTTKDVFGACLGSIAGHNIDHSPCRSCYISWLGIHSFTTTRL